jgi:hypothetical protein
METAHRPYVIGGLDPFGRLEHRRRLKPHPMARPSSQHQEAAMSCRNAYSLERNVGRSSHVGSHPDRIVFRASGAVVFVMVMVLASSQGPIPLAGSGAAYAAAGQDASELTFTSPRQGEVVADAFDALIRVSGTREDIHLLVGQATTAPTTFTHVGRFAVLFARQPLTVTRLVNTSRFGTADTIRLVAIASSAFTPPTTGQIDERALPPSTLTADVEIRRAGAILAPRDGTIANVADTVRVMGFLPNSYLAIAIRPVTAGTYWVQNDGVLTTPAVPIPIRVHFGGSGVYHLYLGVTFDPELFKEGDRLIQLNATDASARSVYWLGPLEVTRP